MDHRPPPYRVLALVVFVATLGAAGLRGDQGQSDRPPAQEPGPPVFRTSIEAVQVTAVVTDAAGAPVRGLTGADFEIVENGALQAITTFAAVDLPVDGIERPAAEGDVRGNDGPPGRTYLIALDDMSEADALRTRWFLRRFIEEYFAPTDTAAVVLITRGMRTDGQDFTNSPQLLLNAIDRFSGGSLDFREDDFMASLRTLTEYMADIRGSRKSIILVSRNIPGDAWDLVDYRPGLFGGLFSDVHPDFQRAISAATRGNVAIYPVDPGGLSTELAAAESFDTSDLERRSSLRAIAEITGGFALTNSNGYAAAFDRLVRENSTYYVLGFNSSSDRRDGRYIPLEVRVRRPGLRVQAVNGYLAPRDRARPRPTGTVFAAVWEAVRSPTTTSGIPMRVFAAPYRGTGNEAVVPVTLELDATRLGLVEQDGAFRGDLEIMLAVTDARGRRRPVMRHRATLALQPDTYARVSGSALRVLSELSLPEGRYQLRVSAGGAMRAGSVVYDLEVPNFRQNFVMSGVSVTSAQASEVFTVSPHARMNVTLPGPPTTARTLDRTDTLVLFAEAYENRRQPHAVEFITDLLDAGGSVVASTASRQETTGRPRDVTTYRYVQPLTLEDLSPGEYVIRITARSTLDRTPPVTRNLAIQVR